MKKISLIIIALCMCLCIHAQAEYSRHFMRFYVPNSDGSPFPMQADGYVAILDNGETYIKIHVNHSHNAVELSDFQKYAIIKGSNVYLKLANNEIVTLTCALNTTIKDGYVTTKNGVYQNYADYAYFPIDTLIIEKLKNHEIVKFRGHFKFEIMDGGMQFTPDSKTNKTRDAFVEALQTTRQKYNANKSKNQTQEILKENPLHGF